MCYNTPAMNKNETNATACWAALMVGDALGAPAEFLYEYEIRERYPEGLREMAPGFGIMTDRRPGEVTDDTQMAVCLHRALLRADGWDADAAREEYVRWLATDPPDVGETVKAGLEGRPIRESQGNGALMRAMPLALWAACHPGFDWESAAREDAALTHPHPVCTDSNALYVYALLQALRPHATRQGVYDSALAWAMGQQLDLSVISTLLAAATTPPDYDDNGGERIGWCAENPVRRVRPERVVEQRISILSKNEATRLMHTSEAHDGGSCLAAVAIMLYAGMRPHECERLRWADVHLKEGVICISPQHSKTGGARCVTIHPPLACILRRVQLSEHERICPPNWRRHWAALHRAAGLFPWRPDVLRHTFATHHLATFRSYAELQLEMGHRSAELLRTRYVAMEGVRLSDYRRGESLLAG